MLDFGVEIEFLVPGVSGQTRPIAQGIATELSEAGVVCQFESYNHERRSCWKIVTDASLSAPAGYVGLELVGPPMNEVRFGEITLACNTLTERLHAKTNRSCGLHVHIGAQQLNIDTMRRLAFLYIENEDIIDGLLPPSRRGNSNQYIRSLRHNADIAALNTATSVEQISLAILKTNEGSWRNTPTAKPSRYVKLNFTSYWRHGTVEFRQHSGTIDPVKIIRWIGFCSKLVDAAAMPQNAPRIIQNAALESRLRRAKKSATIYQLAARPEGVTALEMQEALRSRSAPSPAIPLERLGAPYWIDGRRGGHAVYKLTPGAMEPATLQSLLTKMGLDEDEAQFWRERHALFTDITRAVAADLNDSREAS